MSNITSTDTAIVGGANVREAPGGVAGTIMWVGTVRSLPFSEQLSTAAAAGCKALSINPYDYTRWKLEGLSTEDMLLMAGDAGVQLSHLDPLCRWAPAWIPDNIDPSETAASFMGFSCGDFFRIAEALRVESISAIVTCPQTEVRIDALTECFASLCDRAADAGIRCDLEFIPFWGLSDLQSAWAVVKGADRPNGAVLFDLWHYIRGRPDPALLATIPGKRIGSVQLSDASASVPAGLSMLDDCKFGRVPPGMGEFPVVDVLKQLSAIGGLNNVGPEVFSDRFDGLPGVEIARLCRASMSRVLDVAGVEHSFARD